MRRILLIIMLMSIIVLNGCDGGDSVNEQPETSAKVTTQYEI